eukprot:jgi/Tetstr1/454267/TSEL_041186.t1
MAFTAAYQRRACALLGHDNPSELRSQDCAAYLGVPDFSTKKHLLKLCERLDVLGVSDECTVANIVSALRARIENIADTSSGSVPADEASETSAAVKRRPVSEPTTFWDVRPVPRAEMAPPPQPPQPPTPQPAPAPGRPAHAGEPPPGRTPRGDRSPNSMVAYVTAMVGTNGKIEEMERRLEAKFARKAREAEAADAAVTALLAGMKILPDGQD